MSVVSRATNRALYRLALDETRGGETGGTLLRGCTVVEIRPVDGRAETAWAYEGFDRTSANEGEAQ